MATLVQLRTRLERNVGMYGAVPSASIQGHANDALNDVLVGLARKRKWYWWLEDDETTLDLVAAVTTANLPTDLGRIECILDTDGKPLYPKTAHRQQQYPTGIGDGSKQTYAMGGWNSTDTCKTLIFSPGIITAGVYPLWYYRIPALLSADDDVPDLPTEFHDYLYWRALPMILHAVEERLHVIQWAKAEALEIYRDMEQEHARVIETLTRRIYAVA